MKYKYDGSRVKRPLSLFMRAIAPNINLSDIAEVCKRYPGFLRVAATDAGPERRYYRRCWATFEHNVNIKDICWNLSNIRVKDTELNPIVNREVTNRIRPVSGVTCSPITMQLDMRLAIKLARYLDEKHKLYEATSSNGSAKVENGEMKKVCAAICLKNVSVLVGNHYGKKILREENFVNFMNFGQIRESKFTF